MSKANVGRATFDAMQTAMVVAMQQRDWQHAKLALAELSRIVGHPVGEMASAVVMGMHGRVEKDKGVVVDAFLGDVEAAFVGGEKKMEQAMLGKISI